MPRPTPETAQLSLDTQDRDVDAVLGPAELARGTSIGRYMVLELLGEGGMGVVYRAYDPDLDRSVALKLVRSDRGNPERRSRLRARLVREAQTLAQLSHPNVTAVHDVGIHRDDVFVAMELVEGRTLRRLIADDRLAPAAVIALFLAAARGLAAAHAVGIVHRDFKPDNVLVSSDGEVHVSDFGLALGEDDEPGGVAGTPGYMPPEQAAGREVDHRADQYAFCVSLYEALYGAMPAQPPVLPARTPSGARVPGCARKAIERGLAADPAARFASMDDLVCRLSPRPINRAILIAGAAGVAATAIAIAVMARSAGPSCDGAAAKLDGVWDASRRAAVRTALAGQPAAATTVEKLLDRYTTAWVEMHEASCRATHESGEQSPQLLDLRAECLQRRLSEVQHLTSALATADAVSADRAVASVQALSPLDECANTPSLLEPIPPRDPARSRELREQFIAARVAYTLGKLDEARRAVVALAPAAEQVGDPWLLAHVVYLGARLDADQGKPRESVAQLYRAVEVAESGRASQMSADAWIALIWILGENLGKPKDAIALAGVARGVIARLGGSPRLEALLEDHLGVFYYNAGELALVRPHLERSLQLRKELYGEESIEYGATLQHLALLEQASGNLDKALELHHRARTITETALGPRHRDSLALIGGEGAALFELGRFQETNDLLEQALARAEGLPDITASLLVNLGLARWKLGRVADAKAAFERGLGLVTPETPGRAATLHFNLALVLAELGDKPGARSHALSAAETYDALGAADDARAAREIVAQLAAP